MIRSNLVARFLLVWLLCVVMFSLLARMMDDSGLGWTTGTAVWGAALALALVDMHFRSREQPKD